MPPPPPPANVYPCLDWVPRGVACTKPERLKLTEEELKTVIHEAKSKTEEARKRLGQAVKNESTTAILDGRAVDIPACGQDVPMQSSIDEHKDTNDEDDIIMKEYGLEDYDDEDQGDAENRDAASADLSEDDSNDGEKSTRGPLRDLAEDIASLTYHTSNAEDPYLDRDRNDDEEDDEELIIKPTDNLIVAGHVSKDESSIEVYVYDSEQNDFYLHHDIIQSDYPCCVRWIGHVRNQSRNVAAAGYMNPEICLWDLDVIDVLEPIERLDGHEDAVIDITWNNQTKNIIASGSADKHVRLWNLDECKSISNIKLSGKVSALEFGIYDHSLLLAGDLDQHVSLIDTRSSTVMNSWQLTGEVEKVRWVPNDHSRFLVSDDNGCVYCFDTRHSSQPIIKFHAHQISVTGLEFSPKIRDMLVTASADDTIKVWDTKEAFSSTKFAEPALVKEITDLKVGRILSLRMCPDSPAMIAVGGDNKCNSFKTYDLMSEKEVRGRFQLQ